MSNYFKSIKSKPSIKNDREFIHDDSRLKELFSYYENLTKEVMDSETMISDMEEWFHLLTRGFNVIVYGIQSKREILNTFADRYLSDDVPDYDSSDLNATLDVTTIKYHGYSPPTIEGFLHELFGITENRRHNDNDIVKFLTHLKKNKKHYFFVLHSVDKLIEGSREVFSLIVELYGRDKEFIHIIASADRLNIGKKLLNYRFRLNLTFFWVAGTASFLAEKINSQEVLGNFIHTENKNTKDDEIIARKVSIQEVQDFYKAMQFKSKWLLKHILKDHITRSEISRLEVESKSARRDNGRKSRRLTTGRGKQSSENLLTMSQLLDESQKQFIGFRLTVLKNALGEFVDHNIISYEHGDKNMRCLIDETTCKMFLEQCDSQD